ncbi:MAG TPA: hypothetical protein VFV96_02715 [Verrucomicrobiae bacterium]|nr:hypothetical protein [Verrucomicrobiae bacterium]
MANAKSGVNCAEASPTGGGKKLDIRHSPGLYNEFANALKRGMRFGTLMLALLGVVLVVLAGYWMTTHFLSDQARWDRRRRRSNRPVVNRRRQPAVKFSVRWKKPRKR